MTGNTTTPIRAMLLVVTLFTAAGVLSAEPAASSLTVIAFNVLAPPWAAPQWYPAEMDPSLLDRVYRRERLMRFLRDRRNGTDAFCLQEVVDGEFEYFKQAVGNGFDGFMAHNDPDFWSNWVVPEIPWEPNGTAILVKRSAIAVGHFADRPLGTGNHAAMLDGVHRASGRPLRVISVHLDSDSESNRGVELASVLSDAPARVTGTDVICGDLNEDTVIGSLGKMLKIDGYVDALASLGNREPTHPWSTTYYNSAKWAILDHVLIRGARPWNGDVIDFGLWVITDEVARIEANFQVSGSDHFPVTASVAVP
jgi:endonuclease/exonuclease/phosphatase family metal-dependent hydrolase